MRFITTYELCRKKIVDKSKSCLTVVLLVFRAKYHKLKYGTELQQGDMKPPIFDEPGGPEAPVDGEAPFTSVSNVSWRQGRQLLRQ
jgi:hypothetical protein